MPYKDQLVGVYAITHMASGSRYVGVSTNILRRFSQHRATLRQGKSGHVPLQRAWIESGEAAFSFDVLELLPDASDLTEAEQRWLDATPIALNRTREAGIPKGFQRDDATRAKLSAAAKRRAQTEEGKLNQQHLARARATPEFRQKMSDSSHAYWSTDEARKAQSERRKLYFQSPEARAARSEQAKAAWARKKAAEQG